MVNKTLIAYSSKSGATKDVSEVIADALKAQYNFEVDLVDLRKSTANIRDYANIIVGAGVHGGRVYSEALEFLKQDFGDRKVAFFVCCGGAGDPKNYEASCTKYLTNVLAKYPNLKTVSTEAFGGRMKLLGKTLFDYVDKDKICVWAENLKKTS
jgi:menaquinone-dependent protoporphyrinogen IX oxidase